MSLKKLLEQNLLQKVDPVSIEQVKKRFGSAFSYFNTAKKLFKETEGNESLNRVIYTNLYNAVRLMGETFLLLHGYKATINQHHKTVIQTFRLLMSEGDMEEIFSRLDRMRKNRNAMDYDVDILDVSDETIRQAIKDTQKLANKVQAYIDAKDNQSKLQF